MIGSNAVKLLEKDFKFGFESSVTKSATTLLRAVGIRKKQQQFTISVQALLQVDWQAAFQHALRASMAVP